MNNKYNLTLIDIIDKLNNDELFLGDIFESDYGSTFYVGQQRNSFSSNKVLRWVSNDSEVWITSITAKAKYKSSTKYEPITYKKLFAEIRKNNKSLYYSHDDEVIKYLDLDDLDLLFDVEDIKELKFYIKNF